MNGPKPDCFAHSGICKAIKSLEDDVKNLEGKWEKIQNLLIGTLVSALLSLISVITLLLRSFNN